LFFESHAHLTKTVNIVFVSFLRIKSEDEDDDRPGDGMMDREGWMMRMMKEEMMTGDRSVSFEMKS
jgi:hypothetical protein